MNCLFNTAYIFPVLLNKMKNSYDKTNKIRILEKGQLSRC